MPFPKIEFKIEPDGQTSLKIDGIDIPGVDGVAIESRPGEAPRITVELVVGELSTEVEGILVPHILRERRESARSHN